MTGARWGWPVSGALLMLAGSLAAAPTQGPQQRVVEITGRVLATLEQHNRTGEPRQ